MLVNTELKITPVIFVIVTAFVMAFSSSSYASGSQIEGVNDQNLQESPVEPNFPVSNSVLADGLIPSNKITKTKAPGSISYVLARVVAGLIVVIFLILMLSYLAKRFGFVEVGKKTSIKLKESISVGSKEKILVVEYNRENLLLGVTANSIVMLKSAPVEPGGEAPGDPDIAARSPIDFQQKLSAFLMKDSR